eukprot:evm.model.scf_738.5 EVM.evm.TU.scf_738.5   scf_738:43317-48820(-)
MAARVAGGAERDGDPDAPETDRIAAAVAEIVDALLCIFRARLLDAPRSPAAPDACNRSQSDGRSPRPPPTDVDDRPDSAAPGEARYSPGSRCLVLAEGPEAACTDAGLETPCAFRARCWGGFVSDGSDAPVGFLELRRRAQALWSGVESENASPEGGRAEAEEPGLPNSSPTVRRIDGNHRKGEEPWLQALSQAIEAPGVDHRGAQEPGLPNLGRAVQAIDGNHHEGEEPWLQALEAPGVDYHEGDGPGIPNLGRTEDAAGGDHRKGDGPWPPALGRRMQTPGEDHREAERGRMSVAKPKFVEPGRLALSGEVWEPAGREGADRGQKDGGALDRWAGWSERCSSAEGRVEEDRLSHDADCEDRSEDADASIAWAEGRRAAGRDGWSPVDAAIGGEMTLGRDGRPCGKCSHRKSMTRGGSAGSLFECAAAMRGAAGSFAEESDGHALAEISNTRSREVDAMVERLRVLPFSGLAMELVPPQPAKSQRDGVQRLQGHTEPHKMSMLIAGHFLGAARPVPKLVGRFLAPAEKGHQMLVRVMSAWGMRHYTEAATWMALLQDAMKNQENWEARVVASAAKSKAGAIARLYLGASCRPALAEIQAKQQGGRPVGDRHHAPHKRAMKVQGPIRIPCNAKHTNSHAMRPSAPRAKCGDGNLQQDGGSRRKEKRPQHRKNRQSGGNKWDDVRGTRPSSALQQARLTGAPGRRRHRPDSARTGRTMSAQPKADRTGVPPDLASNRQTKASVLRATAINTRIRERHVKEVAPRAGKMMYRMANGA